MSIARFLFKAAKATMVGCAAAAIGYAAYNVVKEAVTAAKGYEHITPRKNVYNFEGLIVDRRTNNGRHVGCEANDKVKAYSTFCKMCNEFEYCEYESVHATDFPDDYVKEGETEFGEEKHYGTAEEYEHDAEYANTPPTKKERRTVFFKQLGISAKDWLLSKELIDTLMYFGFGLTALNLGKLCGERMLHETAYDDVKKSAATYGASNENGAVQFAAWLCDEAVEHGSFGKGEAVAFGMTPSGKQFVTQGPVYTTDDGKFRINWVSEN